ncbi:hypothetical protein QBC39DRAFT_356558 [Podospora conica]|nr:hypothetical protein QBC39DRAFT_356558 [Schizothecium conicum]
MPEDDIIMSEDDIMSDYMDSDSEGAAREWTVTEDSNVQDLDDSDLEWDARGYQADIGLKLRVDDTTHGGASRMENLRRAAFTRFKFDPQLITQGDEVLKLVPAELHLMLRFFFKEMVDPVCDRVHGVIWAHTLVDTAATIAHGRDKKTQMLEALKLGPGSNEITRIQYHIALVRLSKSWARIKLMVSTEPLTAKAEEFLSYAPPAEGVSNVDRAMAVVCNNFRIEKSAFQSYLNDATLVSSLVEVFGKGSIMFCGSVIFGHRSSPIPASASWFFFQVIKAADKDNVLQMIADKLKLSVVRYIWNDKSIPWAHNRENRLYCLDKMPLFPLLSALTETIKNY